MPKNTKARFIVTLLSAGLFVWACSPAAAAVVSKLPLLPRRNFQFRRARRSHA